MTSTSVACQLQAACQLILAANLSCGTLPIAVDTPSPRQSVTSDDYTACPEIGVAYKYFNQLRSWDSARKFCIKEGGNLAIVDTFQKIEYIMLVKPSNVALHVGIYRHSDSNKWISVKTGLPVTITSWATIKNFDFTNLLCASMWEDGRGITADTCESLRYFICEIPLSVY